MRARRRQSLGLELAGLLDGDADGVDAAHLPGADADRGLAGGDHDRVGAHVPADAPGEQHVLPLPLAGGSGAHDAHLRAGLGDGVAVLDEQSADHGLGFEGQVLGRRGVLSGGAVAAGVRDRAEFEQAHVLLLLEYLERAGVETGGEQDLDELAAEGLGTGAVDPAVERDDAAVGALGVAGEGAFVGGLGAVAEGAAAGVVVLDDRAGGLANSSASSRAELRSSRLLKESSLPCSWRTPASRCVGAPVCA